MAGGHGGVFSTEDFSMHTNTFIRENEIAWLEYMAEQARTSRNYLVFNGSNGVVLRQPDSKPYSHSQSLIPIPKK